MYDFQFADERDMKSWDRNVSPNLCDTVCSQGHSCCDAQATCSCATQTGSYGCACQQGYKGDGKVGECDGKLQPNLGLGYSHLSIGIKNQDRDLRLIFRNQDLKVQHRDWHLIFHSKTSDTSSSETKTSKYETEIDTSSSETRPRPNQDLKVRDRDWHLIFQNQNLKVRDPAKTSKSETETDTSSFKPKTSKFEIDDTSSS